MGIYLNPGNEKFYRAINSEIYVDKSELIIHTNKKLMTQQSYFCVSRPRRFGKSTAANMLAAYYGRDCDSREMFKDLKIAKHENYEKYLNKYDVIFLNMQEFLSRSNTPDELIDRINKLVAKELVREYQDVDYFDINDLSQCMQEIYYTNKVPFIVIIDEWDCVFREYKNDKEAQEKYLDFLRDLLKDKEFIHLTYMTGILPIKKYGTHSALNMFAEYSMTNPIELAEFVGFTKDEVEELCKRYDMSLEDIKYWYDGYSFLYADSVYSPRSVVMAVMSKICDSYWNQTETFEALRTYIDMNFEGLKDDVLSMILGERIDVKTGSFGNDMTSFDVKDDVLTLLIHLGYLAYDMELKQVYIPNNEVREEFVTCVSVSDWGEVSKALNQSSNLLKAIWQEKEELVAQGIEQAHFETSHIQYNDENALSYTILLALFTARNFYTIYRELPSGKGFADMVFIPKKRCLDKPALVVELKWNQSANGAIAQIKNRQYIKSLEDYKGDILLVGINYDKTTRKHECVIERMES